jgi:hypothetical protein
MEYTGRRVVSYLAKAVFAAASFVEPGFRSTSVRIVVST